jgi:hypothetical protein
MAKVTHHKDGTWSIAELTHEQMDMLIGALNSEALVALYNQRGNISSMNIAKTDDDRRYQQAVFERANAAHDALYPLRSYHAESYLGVGKSATVDLGGHLTW